MYKDSRLKTSGPTFRPVLAEMMRLLEIDAPKALELLDPNTFLGAETMISVATILNLTDAESEIAKAVEAHIDGIISAKIALDPEAKMFDIPAAGIDAIPGISAKIKANVVKRYTVNGYKADPTPAGITLRIPHKGRAKGSTFPRKPKTVVPVLEPAAVTTPPAVTVVPEEVLAPVAELPILSLANTTVETTIA